MPPASEGPASGPADRPDYRKLDAALASAMDELPDPGAPDLAVFVHLAQRPTRGDQDRLSHLGLPRAPRRRTILTATLSPRQVASLSRDDLVRQLRLSQRLDLLRGGGSDPFGL